MGFSSYTFFLVSISMITFYFHTPVQTTAPILLQDICESASNPDMCDSFVNAHSTGDSSDLNALAVSVIKAATSHVANMSAHITQLLSTTKDPILLQCYNDCSDNYLDAFDQLDDSVDALESKDYSDVNSWVSTAMIEVEACEEDIKGHPSYEWSMEHQSEVFKTQCNIILAITNILAP